MKLRTRRMLVTGLVILGVWQTGAGMYIHLKAWLAQQLIADAWSRELRGEHEVHPWPWADTWPIARLRVPAIGVDLYVLADASGRSLAFGPGWLQGSAAPGSLGQSIIAAHRDTHFRFLRNASAGTQVSLQTVDGKMHAYELVAFQVFDVRTEHIEAQDDDPALVLLTCYPFDAVIPGGPLRYAAIAMPAAALELAPKTSS